MSDYYLIVKTGDAEMKALEKTSPTVLDNITPIVELTRGRKLQSREKDPEKRRREKSQYPYDKKLEKIKTVLSGRKVFFDLTSDEGLMSDEIDALYNPSNGYHNWVNFVSELQASGSFSEIVPIIVISGKDSDIDAGIVLQTQSLVKSFNSIAYRSDISDDNCYYDIQNNIVPNLAGKKLYVIIDCSYVVQASISQFFNKVKSRVTNLQTIVPNGTEIIVSATSFPRNIGEIGNDIYDSFKLSEVELYKSLVTENLSVKYSDYGSINPVRNDTIIMAHGWIPRIDVPLAESFYYCRERRQKNTKDYAVAYKKAAIDVISKKEFPTNLDRNWGIQQIRACAAGYSPGASPAFWISVRMCIHLEQQVNRLKQLDKMRN